MRLAAVAALASSLTSAAGADAGTAKKRWQSISNASRYMSHEIFDGKPILKGLPSVFGGDHEASTLIVHLHDIYSSVAADLSGNIGDYDMLELKGEWAREGMRVRRKVDFGTQGFGSTTGYSSHLHNPFLVVAVPTATQSHGETWGFSLVCTGSFAAEVEKGPQGLTPAVIGLNPSQLS